MLCTEEEIDAGGKFIKEQDDFNRQISELIGRMIQRIKKESTVNDRKKKFIQIAQNNKLNYSNK